MYTSIAAYLFVAIDDPEALAARLRTLAETHGLLGTALVATEGLNLFLAGERSGVDALLDALRTDARFASLRARYSESRTPPFARLKVKVKPEIISFRRESASPLAGHAPTVSPAELRRWIERGHDDAGRPLVLLDTRNREEVGHGSFASALALPIDRFTDLPAALAPHRDALEGTRVVGFCTGGIRCEKAVRWMREEGLEHAVQLEGGILGYFEAEGGFGYEGSCFVFDARVAVDPGLRAATDMTCCDSEPR